MEGVGATRGAILRAAQDHLGLTAREIWVGYIGVGGNAPLVVLERWLAGDVEPSAREHDLMAQSMNDRFIDLGLDHVVPYADALAS